MITPPRRSHPWMLGLQLGTLVLAWVMLFHPGPASGNDLTPRIVILNSYHQGGDWADKEIAGVTAALRQRYPYLEPTIEHLDTKRFPGPNHLLLLKNYLAAKYRGRKVDLLITLDNSALDLVLRHRNELFQGVPIVFAGVNGYRPEMIAGYGQVTGVAEVQDMTGTVRIALALNPRVKDVLAIIDYTNSGLALKEQVEQILPEFQNRIQIKFPDKGPFSVLERRLKELDRNAVAIILTYVTDASGRTFSRSESTRLISRASPVPVYAMHETRLGHGIVGGMLLEGREHGKQAGEIALRILAGEKAADIPVEDSRSRPVFDFEQLERFHLPLNSLPPDSVIINRPIGLWERHREVIPPILSVISLLTLLVVLLSLNVLRRKRAEESLRQNEKLMRTIAENFPHSYLSIIEKDLTIGYTAGQEFKKRNLDPNQFVGLPLERIFGDHAELIKSNYLKTFKGQERSFELFVEDQYQLYKTVPLASDDGSIQRILSVVENITERKRAEAALRESQANLLSLTENTDGMIWAVDKRYRLIVGNKQFDDVLYRAIGRRIEGGDSVLFEDLGPNLLNEWKGYYDRALHGEQFEVELPAPFSARPGFMEYRFNPILDARTEIIGLTVSGRDTTERKKSEERLKTIIHEKEVLIQEIHHRVKNNMQVIISLLNLQSSTMKDQTSRGVLQECQGRVYAMAAVHETLHNSGSMSAINLEQYVSRLVEALVQTYYPDERKINIDIRLNGIEISLNQATSLGLVIHEIVTNSLKYAFPDDREGVLTVRGQSLDGRIELVASDDGPGFSDDFDWRTSESLGLRIVRTLVEDQLEGTIELNRDHGTSFTIRFNPEK